MKRKTLTFTAFFSFVAIAASVSLISYYLGSTHMQEANAQQPPSLLQLKEDDAILGDKSAPVTIVEYSSMSCPHCASFHETILPKLKEKYIDQGKVVFTNRHFPLNAPALRAAMLTKCVGPEREATFTNVLFDLQDKWAFSNDFESELKKLASVGGVSPDEFDACMANETLETKLLESRQQATDLLKISSTPTFFINGVELKGALDMKRFEEVIDAALAVESEK